MALEYYLGPKRAWVFAVSATGQVTAHRLCDAAGKPLDSADLIRRVQQFRQDIGFQAIKMQQRLLNDQGFDHAWQDTLHRFYQELLPESVRSGVTQGKTLVIVPHHVLHYFPFAALVTRPDTQKHGAEEMVNPQFLADEPIALCYAPSLADWDLLRQRSNQPLPRAFALAVPNLPGALRCPVYARTSGTSKRPLEQGSAAFA